jgi:SWIB/MDM2 domain
MARAPNPALLKPVQVSSELEAVVGAGPMTRAEVTKRIWDYIKANNLQNPSNKRNVLADEKLRTIFKKDEATMFEMTKLVNAHLKQGSLLARRVLLNSSRSIAHSSAHSETSRSAGIVEFENRTSGSSSTTRTCEAQRAPSFVAISGLRRLRCRSFGRRCRTSCWSSSDVDGKHPHPGQSIPANCPDTTAINNRA